MERVTLRTVLFLSVFCLFAAQLSAQYQPPGGGESLNEFLSPTFLAGGASLTSQESPASDGINPASSGAKQRTTIDLSYVTLLGLGAEPGMGHGANLGLTLPTKIGVFSSSLHFLSSPFNGYDLGTLGGAKISFAKDLYPNLLIGAGLNFLMGSNDVFDWGLGMDLGFLQLSGDLGFMKDFKWGMAIQGLGKGYAPASGFSSYPSPFTPLIGVAFSPLKTKDFNLGLHLDAGFPAFQNLTLALGGDFTINGFSAQAATRFDLKEWLTPNQSRRSLWPSFGVSFTFKPQLKKKVEFLGISERGWDQSEIKIQTAAAPLYNNIWGGGLGVNIPLGARDENPPDVIIEYPKDEYISPNHDGESDDLVFPIQMSDTRYIKGYVIRIKNEKGELVREIRNKDERVENKGFQNILDRLLAVKQGITLPETFRWDGTTDSGAVAADGVYSFDVEAWDDNDNHITTPDYRVVVDNTQPEIDFKQTELADRIFSPNGDNQKDLLEINQSGSKEELWTGEIKDVGGNVVNKWEWKESSPQDFSWDGKNSEGMLLPDGVYTYTLKSRDKAGNRTAQTLDNIIINTMPTPISLAINLSNFSPNGDGVKDEIVLTPGIPVKNGIESWLLRVEDRAGKIVRKFIGESEVPEKIVFDGKGDNGQLLPEQTYRAQLQLIYQNGNRPEDTSPDFSLDLTPPAAAVAADYSVFSPNGDGKKDYITYHQETSREDLWKGEIKDSGGNVVKSFSWVDNADVKVSWDGRNDKGELVADGVYDYQLSAVDRAGNRGQSKVVVCTIDTAGTPVFLTADLDAFSPNADGVNDRITFTPKIQLREGIESFHLDILNDQGKVVRVYSGGGQVENAYRWEGLTDDNQWAPDGRYFARISLRYKKGDEPVAKTNFFVLDKIFPKAKLELNYPVFSPNGDGKKDTVTIRQDTSQEDLWEGKIVNSSGEAVKKVFWKGKASAFIWDGTDDVGNAVADGLYGYVVSAKDRAGNYTEARIKDIRVDNRLTSVFITASGTGFSPNDDGVADTMVFNTIVNLPDGIASWRCSLNNEKGEPIKVFSGKELPKKIVWDGKSDQGRLTEGRYYAEFAVVYQKGDEPLSKTALFDLDISAPQVDMQLSPVPFSPDNDGVDDELFISLAVTDMSELDEWKLQINDPVGNPFTSFGGKGKPTEKIIWDGRSAEGELVQAAEDYPYTLKIADVLGNTKLTSGLIPVDVLVIRVGDKLKIKIASINFLPNSPELDNSDLKKQQKNSHVLKRLAEILNKYKQYSIRIEGHANNLSWFDPQKAEQEEVKELIPLSEARANTIKDALEALGVNAERINTLGLGGKEPVVPFSDAQNRWKNRRVEFILIK